MSRPFTLVSVQQSGDEEEPKKFNYPASGGKIEISDEVAISRFAETSECRPTEDE